MTDAPLKFHSFADIFPLMEGAEFEEFVADIEAHGLREPITRYKGQILEGRNRYRACQRLGATLGLSFKPKHKPRFEEFKGDDAAALAFVISRNLHRRHLTAEDRCKALVAIVAAQPEKSDRAIAAPNQQSLGPVAAAAVGASLHAAVSREAGVADHKQVSRARKQGEATRAIPPVDRRKDDPKQLRKNFNDPRCRGKAGVGVPTGEVNGIFVVEADTKKGHGVDGLASLKALQKQYGELPATLRVKSPTGSLHYYFNYPDDIKVKGSTSEIAKGVDVKADGGMVIAPTSMRPGVGRYEWLNDLEIADAPQWLIDLVRDDAAASKDDSDSDDAFAQVGLPNLDEVAAAMAVIPNTDKTDRKQWVDIGHALKAACPGDEGLELFKEWSARWTGGEYDEDYTVNAWNGFEPNRTGVNKLFKLATAADPNWREKWKSKAAPSKSRLVIVRASDVTPEELHWIWPGHLLRGSQELVTGLPGLGKSQVQCSLVACCTACLPWPDGAVALDEPMNVVMLTAEDSIAQGLVPRLIAAGADTKRVHIVKCIHRDKKDRQFLLGEDLHDLELTIREIGNVGLITIDPITAYMGGKMDSHKTTEVRSQLGPLKDFAERLDVAISTVTHPAKNAGPRAIDHFIGSQAFIAAGRVGHGCFQEMETNDLTEKKPTGRMLYTHVKHSMSRKMPMLAYRLVADTEIAEGITPSRVVWDGEVDINADDAVAGAKSKSGSIHTDEQRRATNFLLEILAKGPRFQAYVEEEADQRGISKKVLRTVKDRLKVVSKKTSLDKGWMWSLPPSIVTPFSKK
jgi:putative DNA primase/helicase